MKVYQTSDPANSEEQFEFKEVSTQTRDFRSDQSRNTINIATESLKHGNKGVYNKLGSDWKKKNNNRYPTLNEIITGFKEQEKVQMQKANPSLDPSSEQFKKAYDTKCKGWDSYFEELVDATFEVEEDDSDEEDYGVIKT